MANCEGCTPQRCALAVRGQPAKRAAGARLGVEDDKEEVEAREQRIRQPDVLRRARQRAKA
eukprot:3968373-Prymnesium_polylepis.1